MVLEEISKRRSIREYKDALVEESKLLNILEAGRLAPTARNRQEWKVIIVTDPELKMKMVDACNGQAFVKTAAALLVAVSTDTSYTMRCGVNAGTVDTTIVLQNMVLQAEKEGLGTCYIGSFFNDQVKRLLSIPSEMEVIQILTLGYADEAPESRPRKDLKEFYCHNKYE